MFRTRRIAAAVVAGVAASALVASPALAVYSFPSSYNGQQAITAATDAHEGLGHVSLTYVSPGVFDLDVCDARSDGYVMTGRVDPGDGNVVAYSSYGVGELNCNEQRLYGVRKFRLAWNNYASPWEAPPPAPR